MRKVLSILLAIVFCLPPGMPFLALGQSDAARLPACCRRGGAHQCAMSMAQRDAVASNEAQWKAPVGRCPYAPASVTGTHLQDVFVPVRSGAAVAASFVHPMGAVQTESRRRVSHDRSKQKRGPPSSIA